MSPAYPHPKTFDPLWPHRVWPLDRTIWMANRRGSARIAWRTGDPARYVFTADVYGFRSREHPQRHLGWWRFELPGGRGRGELHCDFAPVGRESVWLTVDGAVVPAMDAWFNPDYPFDPLADLDLVVRDTTGRMRRIEPMLLKFPDRDVLRGFYQRQYTSAGYSAPEDRPFLWELHAHKLGRLKEIFDTFIPRGGRVLDVGCGRSLFTEIEAEWPFTVVAGDLNFDSVRNRSLEVRRQTWGVFDASLLPFRNAQFDALFAGEVIEHVPDAREALREWARVVKPGGVVIVTTPNRDRLVSRLAGIERPYGMDHLSEISYRDLVDRLLPDAGLEFAAQSCIHLEIWLEDLLGTSRLDDFLQAHGNRSKYVWAMRRLMPLGRLFPSLALALIVMARKPRIAERPAASG